MIARALGSIRQIVNMIVRYGWYSLSLAKSVRIAGVTLSLDSEALSPKMRRNLKFGHYEAHEQRILLQQLSEQDRILELGAGVGFLSILAAAKVPQENITAVEANPALIGLIEKNQQLNQVSSRIINAVLGDGECERDFYVAENFWASSLQPIENAKVVKVTQLDFQATLDKIKPTFLIIDIEGGEYGLLQGIRLDMVQKCVLELHPMVLAPRQISQILETLSSNGLHPDLLKSEGFVYYFCREQ